MAIKTPEEYRESIGKIKYRAFIGGKRVDNVLEHPNTRAGIEAIAKTYELALDPRYEELMTATSYLTGDRISRWDYVPRSVEDLVKRRQMNILMSQKTGTCYARCGGTMSLQILAGVTYAMEQKLGTEYHQRFNSFLRYMQENDLSANQIITDAKGDRSKRPLEQESPDYYLHVSQKTADGIIVRGVKTGPEGCCGVHEHIVTPYMPLRKGEEDYAICFAVPAGAEGITYVLQDTPSEVERRGSQDLQTLGSPIYGSGLSYMIIFDDVFVPWERVFMCGEMEFIGDLLAKSDASFTNLCAGSCKVGWMDLVIGAAQTIAEYNGISRAAHVRGKITEMIRIRETTEACAAAGALLGKESPPGSGVYYPEHIPSLVANINTATRFSELTLLAADLAGGSVVTMPSELELQNPETSQYIRKYLQGVASVPTENRMRMLKFLQHWTAGPEAARVLLGAIPGRHQLMLYGQSVAGLEEKKQMAKDLAGIKE